MPKTAAEQVDPYVEITEPVAEQVYEDAETAAIATERAEVVATIPTTKLQDLHRHVATEHMPSCPATQ